MKFSTIISIATSLATPVFSSSLPLEARQSTTWQYTCQPNYASPSNFKAFNVGGCAAQLSFTKDRYVSKRWHFDAVYVDGSRVAYEPNQGSNNFGVSDPFYPHEGNNFLTRLPGASAFTAVVYSIIVEYPSGEDETGNPYTNVRGPRIQAVSVLFLFSGHGETEIAKYGD